MQSGSVFMHSPTLSSAWVKNVYNMCVISVISRAYLSPAARTTTLFTYQPSAKPLFSTHIMNTFPPTLYTAFFGKITDTITHLYTFSTPPIIKKMK